MAGDIERCAKALMASYWGWSPEQMEREWDTELGDADRERAREAARACLHASGAVEALREYGTHKGSCEAVVKPWLGRACSCGFAEARAAAGGQ